MLVSTGKIEKNKIQRRNDTCMTGSDQTVSYSHQQYTYEVMKRKGIFEVFKFNE